MRDTETGGSKGFAFINFASFEASDAGIIYRIYLNFTKRIKSSI